MCGAQMVEVRASHLRGLAWQDWECPRCQHKEHDRYDDWGTEDAGPEQGH